MQEDDTPFDPGETLPSKTRRKKDAEARQNLGIDLLGLPESDWRTLELPEELVLALREARHIRSNGARKRQFQYIGKLMRDIDPEPIRAHFEILRQRARRASQAHHRLEKWRDRIIGELDPAIDAFLSEQPSADRQHLRQLARRARREHEQGRPPRAARALFRYLRELEA